uniref:Uncharacterized protein n=1 Tax=Guillardia theta TaxID=55529 RepID=A0A7S4PEW4_GUITH
MEELELSLADEDEKELATREVHPAELAMFEGTQTGERLKHLRQRTNATVANQTTGKIFFMEDFGPQMAQRMYEAWVRETAQTIREKLYQGRPMSRKEWEDRVEEQKKSLVYHKFKPNSQTVRENFWSYSVSEEAKIYHDLDLQVEQALLENGTVPEHLKPYLYSESDEDSNATITPAYMKEDIIDHLGIQPPEQVKKSVVEALKPLTEEEQKIKLRSINGSVVYYNPDDDDGSYRLRPTVEGKLRQKFSHSEDENDPLFVPKVGKHKAAEMPAVADYVQDLIGVPDRLKTTDEVIMEEDDEEHQKIFSFKKGKKRRLQTPAQPAPETAPADGAAGKGAGGDEGDRGGDPNKKDPEVN